MKICCFAGHSNIYDNQEKLKFNLKNEIIKLIEKEKVNIFYCGGKGAFDWLCAKVINELKQDHPFIKSYLILAYLPTKNKTVYDDYVFSLFNETIYPDLENIPPRFAILKRNEWMIKNSDFLISYVIYDWGGAAKAVEFAKKQKILR